MVLQRDDALNRDPKYLMTQRYTHRGLRCGLALLIATSGAGFATAAFSQAVPVPKPAPKARDGGMQMSAQDKAR